MITTDTLNMATGYRRRNRSFESKLAERANALRARQEAEQLAEMERDLQDELIPVLVMLCHLQDEREGS